MAEVMAAGRRNGLEGWVGFELANSAQVRTSISLAVKVVSAHAPKVPAQSPMILTRTPTVRAFDGANSLAVRCFSRFLFSYVRSKVSAEILVTVPRYSRITFPLQMVVPTTPILREF